MDKNELNQFFEAMLAEPEGVLDPAVMAARDELAATLMRARAAAPQAGDAATLAKLALYLDGALDSAEAENFIAALLRDASEIYDLEAAQSFLDRVSAEKSPAPAELVAAVTADCVREARKPVVLFLGEVNSNDIGHASSPSYV